MTSPQPALDFSGRVALVTGGGRGVGRGVSERFLARGARVFICGRNDPDELPAVGDAEAEFLKADVRDYEQVENLMREVRERGGRLDALINNAGGSPAAAAADASPRYSKSVIELNLLAPLYCAQCAYALMRDQDDGGAIVNIASISATRNSPQTAAYAAAKAGLVNLTGSLAAEWAPKVRVNAIIAGLIATENANAHYGDERGVAAVARTIPMQRLGAPGDIGDACLFLTSPMASWVSGAALEVHGGGDVPAFLEAVERATSS